MSNDRTHLSPDRSIVSPSSDGRATSSDSDDATQASHVRNVRSPPDALSPTSTLPRLASAMSHSTDGGTNTLRVARILPTPRPASGQSPPQAFDHEDYGSSGDESGSGSDDGRQGEGGDTNVGSSPFQRPSRTHRSIRLNAQERLQRQPVVIPHRYASIRLHAPNQGSADERDEDPFEFLPPERELKIAPKQRHRAKKAIKQIAVLTTAEVTEEEEKESRGCCERFKCCRREKKPEEHEEEEITPSTELSPEMQKASNQGLSMVKSIVFPSLPALLQDLWVYLELMISIVAFAFGIIDIFPVRSGLAFNYTYFGLAAVTMFLALIDAFIYFFQLGSCARGIRACRRMLKNRHHQDDAEEEEDVEYEEFDENAPKKCCRLNKKWLERFNTWFELGRNILTELLLYPLLIFDMFDFITDAVYQPEDAMSRADFSLFVIGGFYLILAVYIMRIFMVAGSMISLIRLPSNKNATGNESDTSLLVKFCAHVLGQIIVHLMIILVIAAKINNENREEMQMSMNMTMFDGNNTMMASEEDDEGFNTQASPFLITAIVLGWIIPMVGIAAFFIVNYYWMKEFSIGFWLNMISLLQGESFAETVFGGDGLSATKDKALDFVEKSQYKKVKKQLKRFKAPSVWTKFLFPTRVPITAISGLLYDIALLAFIACLMLTYRDGEVRIVIFTDDDVMTGIFMISVTAIILANIHVLILLNLVLLMVVLVFGLGLAVAVFLSPVLLLIYFPSVACLGYLLICYDPRSSKKAKRAQESKKQPGKEYEESIVLENMQVEIIDEKENTLETKYRSMA